MIRTQDAPLLPREKFMSKGAESMTDVELLTIMIGSGMAGMSAGDIARLLLDEASGSLRRVAEMSPAELCGIKGIGTAKAVEIAAGFELFRRAQNEINTRPFIRTAQDVYDIMAADIGMIPHEELWVLYVGVGGRLLARKRISQGGLNGTEADRRIIFRHAYALGAQELYLCHNHPSGSLLLSESDVRMTREILKSCSVLGFRLSDHVVVTSSSYLSMRERGLL